MSIPDSTFHSVARVNITKYICSRKTLTNIKQPEKEDRNTTHVDETIEEDLYSPLLEFTQNEDGASNTNISSNSDNSSSEGVPFTIRTRRQTLANDFDIAGTSNNTRKRAKLSPAAVRSRRQTIVNESLSQAMSADTSTSSCSSTSFPSIATQQKSLANGTESATVASELFPPHTSTPAKIGARKRGCARESISGRSLVENEAISATAASELCPHTPTPANNSARKRSGRSRESISERSFVVPPDRSERTELLKTMIMQRAQPKEQVLSPLQSLFLSFADIVQTFPEVDQIDMKQNICNLILDRERVLSVRKNQVEILDATPVNVYTIRNNQLCLDENVTLNIGDNVALNIDANESLNIDETTETSAGEK